VEVEDEKCKCLSRAPTDINKLKENLADLGRYLESREFRFKYTRLFVKYMKHLLCKLGKLISHEVYNEKRMWLYLTMY
jgi:hypothetical protein